MTSSDKTPEEYSLQDLVFEVRNLAASVAMLAKIAMPRAEVERRRKWTFVAVCVEAVVLAILFAVVGLQVQANGDRIRQEAEISERFERAVYGNCDARNKQLQGFLDQTSKAQGLPPLVIPPVNCQLYVR